MMTIAEVEQARKLVQMLDRAGENHGILLVQGNLVIRNGVLNEDAPLMFEPADLKNAIELGLLQENRVSGSVEWTWYVVRKVYTTIVWYRPTPDRRYTVFTPAGSREQATGNALEAIRLNPPPGEDMSEMEHRTLDGSRLLHPGERPFNYSIHNPSGSELAVG